MDPSETTEKVAVAGNPEVGNDLEAVSKPLERLTTARAFAVGEGIGLFQRSRVVAQLSAHAAITVSGTRTRRPVRVLTSAGFWTNAAVIGA
jgi:hypothetical protein